MIRKFDELLAAARSLPPRRVAVAAAHDDAVLAAVRDAREQGIAEFVLVGDQARLSSLAGTVGVNLADVEVIHEPDVRQAARRAAAMVGSGQADMLMKGLIGTGDFLRALLDKEAGLRTGSLLSHVFVLELAGWDRLLFLTDAAMNVSPSLADKAVIIGNAVALAGSLGVDPVRVAVLAAVETVEDGMPATLEAAALAKMAERGQIKGAIVDGPLALDNAISEEAARHKGIVSPVAGRADVLVVPDIEAGNMLGKSMVYFARARIAGLLMGAAKPVVVTSRADSAESKMLSIALGVVSAK
ncbi:phosphate butyryltransferase [Anaeroselena agilis]|uniref:Phosphate butyryltransferase n=1 Tax=Anaeroselena agilis TaxID=3063788 RepID=A0ABU3NZW0_9FIRM|nr:phosphate butyryltransferase [Selenomonadales bacterium 4137-cl]